MAILESCGLNKIYDEVRKIWVKATPEERIRQHWILKMVYELGYPRELLSVEKELSRFPHLCFQHEVPDRRIDLVCFAKNIHQDHLLYPLLIMEMKVARTCHDELAQLKGYNYYIRAPFLALVSSEHIKFYYEEKCWDFLPSYNQLLSVLRPNQSQMMG